MLSFLSLFSLFSLGPRRRRSTPGRGLHSRAVAPLLLCVSVVSPLPAEAQDLGIGEWVDDGVLMELGSKYLSVVAPQVPWLLQDRYEVPSMIWDVPCPFDCLSTTRVRLLSPDLYFDLLDTELSARDGQMLLTQIVNVRLADPLTTSTLILSNADPRACDPTLDCCTVDACPEDRCEVYSDGVPMRIELVLDLVVTDEDGAGGERPVFDFSVVESSANVDEVIAGLTFNASCESGTDLDLWLGAFLDVSLGDAIRERVQRFVDDDVISYYGTALDEAVALAERIDPFTINDRTIEIHSYPANLDFHDNAMRMYMDLATRLIGPADPCIFEVDPRGSTVTDNPIPAFSGTIPGDGRVYGLGLVASDEFLSQMVYTVWRAGALCMDMNDETFPIPLDTDFVGRALGEPVRALFDNLMVDGHGAVRILTYPPKVPAVDATIENGVRFWARDLELRFYIEVLGRFSHAFTVTVDLGVDVITSFTEFGELDIETRPYTGELNPRVTVNELLPWGDRAIEAGFPDFMEGINEVLDGVFWGHQYSGPVIYATGDSFVESVEIPMGPGVDWRAMYMMMDVPAVGRTPGGMDCGCGLETCLDPAQCGCSTEGPRSYDASASIILLLLPFAVMWAARKR